jgi:hypothetical protein
MIFNKKVTQIPIKNFFFIKSILLADQAKGDVYTSTTGTAHIVSASHDSNAPHGDTTTTKVEVKTTGTNKPPLV